MFLSYFQEVDMAMNEGTDSSVMYLNFAKALDKV